MLGGGVTKPMMQQDSTALYILSVGAPTTRHRKGKKKKINFNYRTAVITVS